jgi:hypothetical protein
MHPVRYLQPATASPETRLAHWGIVGGLLLLTGLAAMRRRPTTPADRLILLGLLMLIMLHATPVSHMHYYAFGLPLVSGLWLKGLAARPGSAWPGWAVSAPVFAWGVATALPRLDGELAATLRHRGLGPLASLLLIGFGVRRMGRPVTVDGPATIPFPETARRRAA